MTFTIPQDYVGRGLLANRPAAGVPGALWVVIDNGLQRLTFDDGTAWHDVDVDSTWAPGVGTAGAVTRVFSQSLGAPANILDSGAGLAVARQFLVVVQARCDQATAQLLGLRLNNDTGNDYDERGVYNSSGGITNVGNAGGGPARVGNVPGTNSVAGDYGVSSITVCNADDSTHFKFGSFDAIFNDIANGLQNEQGGYRWLSTAQVTRIAVQIGAGNFVAGSKMDIYAYN